MIHLAERYQQRTCKYKWIGCGKIHLCWVLTPNCSTARFQCDRNYVLDGFTNLSLSPCLFICVSVYSLVFFFFPFVILQLSMSIFQRKLQSSNIDDRIKKKKEKVRMFTWSQSFIMSNLLMVCRLQALEMSFLFIIALKILQFSFVVLNYNISFPLSSGCKKNKNMWVNVRWHEVWLYFGPSARWFWLFGANAGLAYYYDNHLKNGIQSFI